jgi:D-alanyl-D-alanine carboxypeptidase
MEHPALPAGLSIGRAVVWFAIAIIVGGWAAPARIQSDDTLLLPPASAAPSPESTDQPAGTPAPLAGTKAVATQLPRPPVPPPCQIADDLTRPGADDDWALAVVDTALRLPADYAPPDLVRTVTAGIEGGGKVRKIVIADLRAMAAQARGDGIPLRIRSAYRSESRQAAVFSGWAGEVGRKKALRVSARPGHSEHQLGTTIDFARSAEPPWGGNFAATRTGRWLATNAADFGFVMSYPKGASHVTCYAAEPWHFRWIGRDRAAAVAASGLTLREWLWRERLDPEPPVAELLGLPR